MLMGEFWNVSLMSTPSHLLTTSLPGTLMHPAKLWMSPGQRQRSYYSLVQVIAGSNSLEYMHMC